MKVPIISYPHYRFDTVEMAARKDVKRAHLHREWQDDWDQYYRVRNHDSVKLTQGLKHYNLVKDIEEIKAYEALRRHWHYYMYRYNTSLGRNLDVYV